MTNTRTSTTRGTPSFDPQASEQSTQEAASQSSRASSRSATIAPISRNESELDPLQSLQQTRLAGSADDNSARSSSHITSAYEDGRLYDSRSYAEWEASRVASHPASRSTTTTRASTAAPAATPTVPFSVSSESAPRNTASLPPSLPTSRFAPSSARPPLPPPQKMNTQASSLGRRASRRLETALKIVDKDFLSAWSDGTKSVQHISQSNNFPDLRYVFTTSGSLTDKGKNSFAQLSIEQRALFDEANAKRRQTLPDGVHGMSRGGSDRPISRSQTPSAALKFMDDKFLSDLSDGRQSLRNIGMSNDFSGLIHKYLSSDGSLTDKGQNIRAHLDDKQTARFDAALALRKQTLSASVLAEIKKAQSRASKRSGAGSSSHQPSSRQDLISQSGGPSISSSHQTPPNDLASQLMSAQQHHVDESAVAMGRDDSSPGPSFFSGLTPYQNQFMPSQAAGNSPSLHGQEVDSRWSRAALSRTPQGSSLSRHSTPNSPTFGGLTPFIDLPTPSHSRSNYPGSSSHQPSPQNDLISLLKSPQPAQRMNEPSTPGSADFRGLSTPGASFDLPEGSHFSSIRSASTHTDLSSLRSEIPEDSFRVVAEGLSLTDHINTLADLEAYSNVPAASLNRLVSEQTASDGSTRLQLTSVGDAYLNRFGSEEQRHTLSHASSTRSKRRLSLVDELRSTQSNRKR